MMLRLVDQILETLLREALDGVVTKVSYEQGSTPWHTGLPFVPSGPASSSSLLSSCRVKP